MDQRQFHIRRTGPEPRFRRSRHIALDATATRKTTAPPFGDGKRPNNYAWDGTCSNTAYNNNKTLCTDNGGTWTPGTSIDARYSQLGSSATTTWGKYTDKPRAAQKNIKKAYSAHGNASNNQEGWDQTPGGTGVDGAITDFTGSTVVACYDCHNSHGSGVGGTTTSYGSGGLLKSTTPEQRRVHKQLFSCSGRIA